MDNGNMADSNYGSISRIKVQNSRYIVEEMTSNSCCYNKLIDFYDSTENGILRIEHYANTAGKRKFEFIWNAKYPVNHE